MEKSFNHSNIARPVVRIWDKKFVNQIAKDCSQAGYDIVKTSEEVVIGFLDTDQIFLRAMKMNGKWMTRYDAKLFDENAT